MKVHTRISRMRIKIAMASTVFLVLGPATTASGQMAGLEWEKLAIPDGIFWPDSLREPGTPGKYTSNPLATDLGGRLYFNNGAKLHIGTFGGTAWTTVAKPQTPTLYSPLPLAAGAQATVQWGEWLSRDGGATWDSTDKWNDLRSFGILADGSRLLGKGYDYIERFSTDSDRWVRVHAGRTYGYITRFAAEAKAKPFSPSRSLTSCSAASIPERPGLGRNRSSIRADLTGRTSRPSISSLAWEPRSCSP